MVLNKETDQEFTVLASEANWAWPEALKKIFRPRGVNLLVADDVHQFVQIIRERRIHTTIVDMDSDKANGLAAVKIIRMDCPLMPCILLARDAGEHLLGQALKLNVFSVIEKPVEMDVLRTQLDKLFKKRFASRVFSCMENFS